MIKLGVRAHDFGCRKPQDLAAMIYASGASCVQLALSKAIDPPALLPAQLGPAGPQAVKDALAAKGLSVAVLGCYINPVHPDAEAREAALKRFEAHLEAAAAFGCRLVATETGSLEPDCSYHPGTASESTFRTLAASVRRLARFAEGLGAGGPLVAVEAVSGVHTMSSPALVRRLLEEAASPSLVVVFDPVNLVPAAGVASQDAFLDECFAAFGSSIAAVHAKDYRLEGNPARKGPPLPAGTGELDWTGLFRRLRAAGKTDIPVLLEDAGPDLAPGAIQRLRAAWDASA